MPKNSQPAHYPGIPQEITPHDAARLLKEYPQAADIINERLHEYRWAHDPDYVPEPAPEPTDATTGGTVEAEKKEEDTKPLEGKPKR